LRKRFGCILLGATLGSPLPVAGQGVPVVAGQVVETMRVVVPFAPEWFTNAVGQTAEYMCVLRGLSRSLGRWEALSESASAPAFQVEPLPVPEGSFVW
jgi:hypothetical protein